MFNIVFSMVLFILKWVHSKSLIFWLFSQIATASGPCGNNRDYLFRLEKALFDIGNNWALWLKLNSDMIVSTTFEFDSILTMCVTDQATKTIWWSSLLMKWGISLGRLGRGWFWRRRRIRLDQWPTCHSCPSSQVFRCIRWQKPPLWPWILKLTRELRRRGIWIWLIATLLFVSFFCTLPLKHPSLIHLWFTSLFLIWPIRVLLCS